MNDVKSLVETICKFQTIQNVSSKISITVLKSCIKCQLQELSFDIISGCREKGAAMRNA